MRVRTVLVPAVMVMLSLTAQSAYAGDGSPSGSCLSKILAVPKLTAGVIYGVTLGVPIRTTKYIASESHRMTKTLMDDFGGPGLWNMVMARTMGIPYGIASGSVLGLVKGVQLGGQLGAEQPFSKESIGIGVPCAVGQQP